MNLSIFNPFKMCRRQQPESSVKDEATPEEGGTNPTDDTLNRSLAKTHLDDADKRQLYKRKKIDGSEPCKIKKIGPASKGQHSNFNETDDMSENPSEEKLQKGDGTGSVISNSQTYIKIPLSALSDSELEGARQNVESTYKFIDGYPSDRPTDIRTKKYYVMSYNEETKNAEWVYEILNRSTLADNHIGLRLCKHMQNEIFQQGHLAAAANHPWCQEAYNSTFCFSNISPQIKELNNGIWKSLEFACRNKIIKEDNNVHVYTGSIENYSESSGDKCRKTVEMRKAKKGKTRKEKSSDGGSKIVKVVPTHFFKVIIVEKYNGTVEKPECYLIPNDASVLKDDKSLQSNAEKMTNTDLLNSYSASLERIEKLSGLKFTEKTCRRGGADCIKTVKWEGEGGNGDRCTAEIKVRISQPHT